LDQKELESIFRLNKDSETFKSLTILSADIDNTLMPALAAFKDKDLNSLIKQFEEYHQPLRPFEDSRWKFFWIDERHNQNIRFVNSAEVSKVGLPSQNKK
jgi:hypothetical protein